MATTLALKPSHRCRINDVEGTVLLDPVTAQPVVVTLILARVGGGEDQLSDVPLSQVRNLRDLLNWLLEKDNAAA